MSVLASIEARIKEYEAAIAQSIASHNGLLGGLAELKNLLTIASPVVEALIPGAEPIVQAVDTVVGELVEPISEAAPIVAS